MLKRRYFRNVLLDWSAYGAAFLLLAAVGACQPQPSGTVDTTTESDSPAVTLDAPVPVAEPEFSEAVRAEYNAVDLGDRAPAQLLGEDPEAIAQALFGAQEPMEGNYSESSEAEIGNERAVVLFIQDNLPDDSVQAIRTRAEFERIDGPWQLVWAGEQYRCREGRGQQDWAAKLCT